MSSKITGTGAVLPYMTHLMNDAREALTSKDREIERLRNLLSRSEMIMEELRLALEDSIQEIEKLRAAARPLLETYRYVSSRRPNDKSLPVAMADLARLAEVVPEEAGRGG